MKNSIKIKDYFFLHISLFIYSLAIVFGKLAAAYKIISFEFLLFYGISIVILGVYTILWQQNLKKISLTTAFANKSVVIIWGILWGTILFKEKITMWMIAGSIVIILGIKMVISDEE